MSPASASGRAERIAAQLQRSLARLLRTGVKDPRVGNVTVTAVLVVPDLSVATVYVLPFGAGEDAAAAATGMLEGLRSAAGFLRGELARELRLRHAPRLAFEFDRQLNQAHRVTELIDRTVAADERNDAAGKGGARGGDSTH